MGKCNLEAKAMGKQKCEHLHEELAIVFFIHRNFLVVT